MTYGKLHDIAQSYWNGNIDDTRKSIKRMDKATLLDFISVLAGFYYDGLEDGRGNKLDGYDAAVTRIRKLLA